MGVLVGTVDYFAGNVAKNIVDEVLLAVGFRDHAYTNDTKNKQTNVAIVGPEGVSTHQSSETYPNTLVHYDYAKLLQMQEQWAGFFGMQRFLQLLAPYLLLGALEVGVGAAYLIFFVFTQWSS